MNVTNRTLSFTHARSYIRSKNQAQQQGLSIGHLRRPFKRAVDLASPLLPFDCTGHTTGTKSDAPTSAHIKECLPWNGFSLPALFPEVNGLRICISRLHTDLYSWGLDWAVASAHGTWSNFVFWGRKTRWYLMACTGASSI